MKSIQLRKNLWYDGVLDPDIRISDIIVKTEKGTTYNSYVLKGSEKTAVFETAKFKFWDEFEESLREVVDPKDIDYLILNHTEPDHSGSIEKLIELNPRITIVATGTAHDFLPNIINYDYNSMVVADNDTLSLGDITLRFMIVPNLHWPDTMITYDEEDHILFTCDVFGAHYCDPAVLLSKVQDRQSYEFYAKYYFDCILGPFRDPYMIDALKRVDDLKIEMICTGHGPVIDNQAGVDRIIDLTKQWCGVDEHLNPVNPDSKKKLVVIPYVSAYGYTERLAFEIRKGIEEACGADNVTIRMYDVIHDDVEHMGDDLAACDGLMIGTPTILGDALNPIWNVLSNLYPPIHSGKLAAAFGSYGWSGEGVPHVIERLKQLRMNVMDDGFRVRLNPSDVQELDAYEYGYRFGCRLMDKKPQGVKKGSSGLVKCLVCGAIFDPETANGACPVCGAGPDKWVDAPDTSTDFSKDTDEQFLIIGGGPAAFYATEAIRDRNKTANIGIISDEDHLPYNRPMLTKSLLADMSGDQLAIADRQWFSDNNVLLLNDKVTAIDTAEKIVKGTTGSYHYDKLIYAAGAHCFVPPITGADQDHVVSIRNIADAEKVQSMVDKLNHVVVIGGGVMGLEAAWELKRNGIDVTVIEGAPGLLPKQLDDPASAMLEKIVDEQGIHVETGAATAVITEKDVVLTDGRKFPADLVIMSTGMRPNTKLAEEAGIAVDKFVSVDTHMRTNVQDVYAVGDCCAVDGAPQAFFAQAQENGRIAGANAAGEDLEYDPLGASLSIEAMNTSIFALGTNGKDPDENYKTVELRDDKREIYEKYYFVKGILKGVILIGDTSKMPDLTDHIAKGSSFEEVFGK